MIRTLAKRVRQVRVLTEREAPDVDRLTFGGLAATRARTRARAEQQAVG
ncbi:hypothetical protein ABT301_34615 [Streptomyces sp. NPDC000987]